MQRPVPKFGSYKPKADQTPAPEPKQHREASTSQHSHRREEHKSHNHSARQYHTDIGLSSHDDFIFDRRGDRKIITYGSNDPSRLSRYREPSGRKSLGAASAKASRQGSSSLLANLTKQDRQALGSSGHYISSSGPPPTTALQQDFVPLRPALKRKRTPEDPNTVSIPRSAPESDTDPSSEGDETDGSPEDEILVESEQTASLREVHTRLEQQTKDRPKDAISWQKLIDFQDTWVRRGLATSQPSSRAPEDRTLQEIKLALYQDAVRAVGHNNDSCEHLLLGLMRTASTIWSSRRLASEWEAVALSNPDHARLQLERIAFVQTDADNFDMDACKSLYQQFINHQDQRGPPPSGRINLKIDALSRLTSLLRDSGQTELSIAIWQAMIEINLFKPDSLKHKPADDVIAAFEEFWDSEQPRIGEMGSQGWRGLTESSPAEPSISKARSSDNPQNLREWVDSESVHMDRSCLPGKTSDEEDDDDPFHVVLFSDIKDFVLIVPEEDPAIVRHLICAFLRFWDLPLPTSLAVNREADDLKVDPLLCSDFIRQQDLSLDFKDDLDYICMQSRPATLFRKANLPSSSFMSVWDDNKSSQVITLFISHSLATLAHSTNIDGLAQLYLAFEMHVAPDTCRKTARSFIKKNVSRFGLYNYPALIHAALGDYDAACRVLVTALEMLVNLDSREALTLYETLIRSSLLRNRNDAALFYISTVSSKNLSGLQTDLPAYEAPSQSSLLRAEQYLTSQRDAALQSSRFELAISCCTLLSYLAYLTAPTYPLTAALNTHSISATVVSLYTDRNANHEALESLDQSRAELIAMHIQSPNASNKTYKPSEVHSALLESIASFPNNTMFPRLYTTFSSLFALEDRIRSALQTVQTSSNPDRYDKPEPTLAQCVTTIEAELRRDPALGASTHAVRAAFERAVRTHAGRRAPIIWTTWLRWECSHAAQGYSKAQRRAAAAKGAKKRPPQLDTAFDRAKDVFWRALAAVPWCKRVAMVGLAWLGDDALTRAELRHVFALLERRGVRLFVPPPEHLLADS